MDISNKSLAFLLVAAMVLSLGGTIMSLNKLGDIGVTGMATGTDAGTANLSINGSVTITFTVSNVDFGAGYTNDTTPGAPVENCTIATNGTNPSSDTDCIGFNSNVPQFLIQNDGNQDVDLQIKTDVNAATFFTSSNGGVYWYLSDNETSSCDTPQVTSWTAVSTSDTQTCGIATSYGFNFADGSDLVNLHVKVDIPQDAATGSHVMTFTATGTSA